MSSAQSSGGRGRRCDIAEVLARSDLAALLDEHTTGVGVDRARRWHCPIAEHTDAHASVTMHTDARGHERWRCWSGDDTHRGDAIDLLMTARRLSRADAIEQLAERVGLHNTMPEPVRRRVPAPTPAVAAEPVPMHPVVERYVGACERIMAGRAGTRVRNWLEARGLDADVLAANRVGADPGRQLLPRQRGLPSGRSIAATFPAFDGEGRLAYVQTRYLEPAPGGPKYENPAGYLGANPKLAWTRRSADVPGNVLVICEGIPDALTATRAGLSSVALLGAHAADEHTAQRLARHATRNGLQLVSVVDADAAGRSAGQRLARHLQGLGVQLRVIEPPAVGLDLNDWARQDPTWARTLTRAVPQLERDISVPTIGLP